MRFFYNGSGYTVTVTAREVSDFADRWPCSGLEWASVTFSFDADGNLIDSNDAERHPDADGGALVALSEDAQRYGEPRYRRADARARVDR